MIIDIDRGTPITRIPHAGEYRAWKSRLSEDQYQAIVDKLNHLVDGDEVHTSSWIPGAEWGGTVYLPIYEVACGRDEVMAARFFGLILWVVMMEREEEWACGRFEKDGVPIRGLTYFRIHRG
jgi:hypothetical protein